MNASASLNNQEMENEDRKLKEGNRRMETGAEGLQHGHWAWRLKHGFQMNDKGRTEIGNGRN